MNRGGVVLVDWPYSDQTGSKLRPAVVVQADFLNGLIDDTVLAQITSTLHGIPGTEVRIDPAQTGEFRTSSCLLREWNEPSDSRPGSNQPNHWCLIRCSHAANQ
jgi:mRNA-degrading endonuclease toxin of MazEF toxin-antitoxin module